jgi:hypothetical protein
MSEESHSPTKNPFLTDFLERTFSQAAVEERDNKISNSTRERIEAEKQAK